VFKGRKPDFHLAMPPKDAKPFYDRFVAMTREKLGQERVKGR